MPGTTPYWTVTYRCKDGGRWSTVVSECPGIDELEAEWMVLQIARSKGRTDVKVLSVVIFDET
jgi:hypothetical protein